MSTARTITTNNSMGPLATINLPALRHNLRIIRQLAPDSKVMTVIKADAYGHGMMQIARALADVEMLAVARVSEGVELRQAGIGNAIMVLEGAAEIADIALAIEHDLQLVFHHPDQLDCLQKSGMSGRLTSWLKIDTGMHRLGVAVENAQQAYQRLRALSADHRPPGLMTHFANADDIRHLSTSGQIKRFDQIAVHYKNAPQSLANSAAILAWPESHRDWVRPGIMLYGSSPLLGMTAADHHLRPVMTLSSQLLAVNHLKKGDCIGYGSSWCCPQDMPVGVVAIGYGDGYPRHAPSGTAVLVNGQMTQLIGRVSMDMLTVDLRDIDARAGDPVILWGEGLPAETIAEAATTISYELFCGVTARVKYHYIHEED